MIEISNETICLSCRPDGTGLLLNDKHRNTRWGLDERTRQYRGSDGQARPIGLGSAFVFSPGVLQQDYVIEGENVSYRWRLIDDGVEIEFSCEREGAGLARVPLPGAFVAEDEAMKVAIPIMQGVVFERCGDVAFEEALPMGAHAAISMAMLGYIGDRAGLLVEVIDPADWLAVIGQRNTGTAYAYVDARSSLQAMRYPRRVRLYPTDASVTAICKRYRRRVQERGSFKSWEEKIAERPGLDRLFGALMTFVGYNQTQLDYGEHCRKLKAYGFDRAFVYPVRFNTYTQDFKMGGLPPICLSDEVIQEIRGLDYDIAPWIWVIEAIDDGSGARRKTFNRNIRGEFVPNWRIDNHQWYICCTPSQIDFVRNAYLGDMKDMTWAHYDVSATAHAAHGGECYALDHSGHAGAPLDRSGDLASLQELLSPSVNGNRTISSEGFTDTFASSYDIGSTKLHPAWGDSSCWTVPMTMLVYHDSLIHDAWELHNYNAHPFDAMNHRYGISANGIPEEKAIMDALYGSPPNVFPFGRTYKWIDFATHRTVSYDISMEDQAVQQALACALPVTRLHRRIGKLELISHDFLSADGAVQQTVFSDGTRVVGNFSCESHKIDGDGTILAPKSWRVL